MTSVASPPDISVVVPTFNRAESLSSALDSLADQTLDPPSFQVVVVDDGSSDETPQLCRDRAANDASFTYRRMTHGGISLAKNVGLIAARAPIVLFLDDDDLFDRGLLESHLSAHAAHPEPNVAVLGYTSWAPALTVTPLMEYVTQIGQLLFSYPGVSEDQLLDFTHFWGGRSSCKRRFLLDHGIFDPRFTSIIEDIELGYRLSEHGLKVVFEPRAVSYADRPYDFDQFCARCRRRGRALALFHHLHPDPTVADYTGAPTAGRRWEEVAPQLAELTDRVRSLEGQLVAEPGKESELEDLYALYGRVFAAFQAMGIVEEQNQLGETGGESQATPTRPNSLLSTTSESK